VVHNTFTLFFVFQHNPQYVQQQPPINSNAPIYSPFAYQQQQPQMNVPAPSSSPFMPAATTVHQQQQQQMNVSASSPFMPAAQQQQQQQQTTQAFSANPVNFFNPTHFNDSSNSQLHQNNNNNNINSSAFNSVQTPHFEKVNNYQGAKISTVQFSNSNLPPPPPVQAFSSIEQSGVPAATTLVSSSSLPLPPPPAISTTVSSSSVQNQNIYDSSIQGNAISHQSPSSIPTYDSNFNPVVTQPYHQYPQWNDQRHQQQQQQQQAFNSTDLGGFNNSWQAQAQSQNAFVNSQPPPPPPVSSNDWQNISSVQQASGASFFGEYVETQPKDDQQQNAQNTLIAPSQAVQQQPPKFENNENIQTSSSEPLAQSIAPPPPSSTPLYVTPGNASQLNDRQVFESAYPENRERLDELLPPSVPTLDRHNYLVTGQLSQDHSPVASSFVPPQQQSTVEQNLNDSLPPPGLSRMVVGEPENNQQQVPANRNDIRMVTGNEMTPASYLNYQRQADGEVSSSSNIAPIRSHIQQPTFNQQQVPQAPQQNIENDQQQSFNISDRNLYLVAGESDVNSQRRVVPGVESNSNVNIAPISLINPLQNLHIEDDEDFVNVSMTSQQRNVDGDGMEELQQIQRSIDAEQREEDIEGANDSNAIVVVNHPPPPAMSVLENIANPPLNEQESEVREDIEGANDYSDPPRPQLPLLNSSESHEEKRKSIDSGSKKQKPESSEDSELRALEKNARANKMRRSKKYDDSNDSESDHGARRKDKYDDRYKRSSRDKMSRDEYEKYRRREKERRSGGGGGRSKRNDDTDGSRYDSKRRTDDEDDEKRRRTRRSNRSRREEEDPEGAGEDRDRKRDKNRDRKSKTLSYDPS
jgi:hypothetical protein